MTEAQQQGQIGGRPGARDGLSSQKARVLGCCGGGGAGVGGTGAGIGLVPVCLLFFLTPKGFSSSEGHNLVWDLTQHHENVREYNDLTGKHFPPRERVKSENWMERLALPRQLLYNHERKSSVSAAYGGGGAGTAIQGTVCFFLFTFVRLHHVAEHKLSQLKNNRFHPLIGAFFFFLIVASYNL